MMIDSSQLYFFMGAAPALLLTPGPAVLYITTCRASQENRHVHWHIAPLPHGIPSKQQQLEALNVENGILEIPNEEMQELAGRIRQNMAIYPA